MIVPIVLLLVTLMRASVTGEVDVTSDVGNGRYFFSGLAQNWTEAYQSCRDGGGDLAVIRSTLEAEQLQELLVAFATRSVHLGFHDIYTEGKYRSITNEHLDQSCTQLWAPGQPASGYSYNCGYFSTAGVGVGDCLTLRPSICQRPDWYDFDSIPGHGRYKLHAHVRSWKEAYDYCDALGAHLLIVNSQQEIDAVMDKYPELTQTWVGAHRLYGREQFVTVFNEDLEQTGYARWGKNEPTGSSSNQAYLTYQKRATDAGLFALHSGAYSKVPFVCEL